MQQVPLTKHVMKVLRPALWGAVGTIKREITAGVSQVYITNDNNLYVVVRPEGSELVFVAVAGRNLAQSQRELLLFAKNSGYKSIRFHTLHPEHLAKGLNGLKPVLVEKRPHLFTTEYVYRLNI